MTPIEMVLWAFIFALGGIVWGLFFRVKKLEKQMSQVLAIFDGSGISTISRKIEDGTSYVGINDSNSWEDISLE